MNRRRLSVTVKATLLVVGGLIVGLGAGNIKSWLSDTRTAGAQVMQVTPTAPLVPTGTGFTYQGQLTNGGNPASGSHDFTFKLFDALTLGNQVGSTISPTLVLTDGLFTMQLDFGLTAFNGEARYMEIAARQTGGGSYTTLSPRQPITPAPYAIYALKTKGYKGVVTVAQDGGDFTTITSALNSITDNSPTNRYLVWVAPGTYAEQVVMKQYVDIEGSGERLTTVTYTGSATSGPGTGTVIGANNSELRSLTVRNTGGNNFAIGFYNNATSPSLLHVTIVASGASGNVLGVYNHPGTPSFKDVTIIGSGAGGNSCVGMWNNAGNPHLDNVTATCSGGSVSNFGIYNYSYGYSSPSTMKNVTLTASGGAGTTNYGIRNDYSHFAVMNDMTISVSGASAENYGIYNFTSSSAIMSNATITASGGITLNYGVYNTSSSPRMTNLHITANGGAGSNYGVYNTSSSPSMSNLDIVASGGNGTIGVLNISSSPNMSGVVATASGGSAGNYGLYNEASSATLRNGSISASGGTLSYGLYNNAPSGSYTVKVDNSTLAGSTNTIRNDAEFVTRVGATKLEGGAVTGGGTITCAGVHDENYVFLTGPACP